MLLSGAGSRNRSRVKVGPAPQHCGWVQPDKSVDTPFPHNLEIAGSNPLQYLFLHFGKFLGVSMKYVTIITVDYTYGDWQVTLHTLM